MLTNEINSLPSNSIPIPKSQNNTFNEYSLNLTTFDPNKSSPPNSWKSRLFARITSQNHNQQHDSELFQLH